MTIAKIVELSSDSKDSFQGAINSGLERARQSLDGVKGVWVKDQQILIGADGKPTYRVGLKVTFVMNE